MAGYETFIRLSLISNVAEGLAVIIGRLAGAVTEVKKLEKGLAALRPAVLGFVSGLAGLELGKALFGLAKGSQDLLDKQNQMLRLNISMNEVNRLTAKGFDEVARSVPTASIDQYLKTVMELRSVTGDLASAERLAPKALKVDALLENVLGAKGAHSGTEFYKFMRSAEMAGIVTDEAKRDKFTDEVFSYVTSFQGKLTPADFVTLARRGKSAWANAVNMDKAVGAYAVAAADIGGPTAGQSIKSLEQLQLGTAVMSGQQRDIWGRAGLIDLSKTKDVGFGRVMLEPGALEGSLATVGDLPRWIEQYIRPKVMALAGNDPALYAAYLEKMMPNRSAGYMARFFGDEGFVHQRMKDLGLAKEAWDPDRAYASYVNANPKGVEAAYEAQKKSMGEAIGAPVMQAAIPVMQAVTSLFTKIGELANVHPEALKNIAVALGGVAVALAAFGVGAMIVAMAAFIPGGIATIAIAGIVSAIAALAAVNWGDLKKGLISFVDGIVWFAGEIGKELNAALDRFVATLITFGHKLRDFVTSLGGLLNKTSFDGDGFGGARVWNASLGSSSSALAAGSRGQYASMIRAQGGGYADALLKIYGTEGASGYVGDNGSSFGPFMLHYGGMAGGGNAGSGLGDEFTRRYHVHASDPRTVPAQIEFMKRWGAEHRGFSSNIWHGLRRHGGSIRMHPAETHVHLHVDGRRMASVVQKHWVRGAQYATSVGRQDGRGVFMGPGAEVFA
ncbi:MAG: hypothetical protein ACREC4_00365 [Methylocella sp.]